MALYQQLHLPLCPPLPRLRPKAPAGLLTRLSSGKLTPPVAQPSPINHTPSPGLSSESWPQLTPAPGSVECSALMGHLPDSHSTHTGEICPHKEQVPQLSASASTLPQVAAARTENIQPKLSQRHFHATLELGLRDPNSIEAVS